MRTYTKVDVSEQALEDLIRRAPGLLEEGLVYIDHQKPAAGGRLDVLMVDSGKSLVVAELKIVQDDGMLMQALDYYDDVSSNIEALARVYRDQAIDPTQQVRMILVAPDFSQTLVNRCKWLQVPISLFTFSCLKFEGDEDMVPVFSEREIVAPPEPIEVSHIDDHLAYITDPSVRNRVIELLNEIKNWKPGNVTLDATKYAISMKINNRVFAWLLPRRQRCVIGTYDADDIYEETSVKNDEEFANLKPVIKAAMERRLKFSGAAAAGGGRNVSSQQ